MKRIQELIKATQVLRVEGNSDTREQTGVRLPPHRSRGLLLRRERHPKATDTPTSTRLSPPVRSRRLPAAAPNTSIRGLLRRRDRHQRRDGRHGRRILRRPKPSAQTGRHHGHQRQNHHRHPLYDLFRGLGYKVGLISTVVYRIDTERIESTHTTPDAIRLNEMMARMVEAGCEYCFMEVSSHAIVQERIRGLHFTGGIFSNITHDHLDYHKTFAEYIRAKNSSSTISRKRLSH